MARIIPIARTHRPKTNYGGWNAELRLRRPGWYAVLLFREMAEDGKTTDVITPSNWIVIHD